MGRIMRKLTYREIVREFLFFLKKENAYKKYIKAIKQQRKSQFKNWGNYINIFTINSLRECLKNNSNIGYLIDNSFHWASTKEGHDFWSALDNKWHDKMRNIEIVPEKLTEN
jgi:hypothetical protein